MFPVTPAAKEKTDLSSLAAFCLPETRVWGLPPVTSTGISGCRWITSTLRWGCEQAYDGTVSGRLVGLDYAKNRYYSNTIGRFLTPDPTAWNVNLGNPGSMNRYAYTNGDPVNHNDPTGLEEPCDPSLDSGCSPGLPGLPCGFGYGTVCGIDPIGCIGIGSPFAPGGGTGPGCPPAGGPTPPGKSATQIASALAIVDDCYYPNGTKLTFGFTLEVEYQVVDQTGRSIYGNDTLNGLGVVIKESVTTTSGPQVTGGGVWCPIGGNCDTAGSLSPSGTFWDILAGAASGQTSTANQSFLLNGTALPVLTFPNGPKVLKNSYSTKAVTVNGLTATRECGSKHGDPPQ